MSCQMIRSQHHKGRETYEYKGGKWTEAQHVQRKLAFREKSVHGEAFFGDPSQDREGERSQQDKSGNHDGDRCSVLV
jgi:hypothetical protein